MSILPIKSIREEDIFFVGANLVNLAKLYQNDLGEAQGIVITPPDFRLKTVLEHFHFSQKEIFEQSLHLVKREIQKIEPPDKLEKALKGRVNLKKLWLSLLETWLSEIRSRIWREGFYPGLTNDLSAQPVFFTNKITAAGEAYFDFVLKHASIKINFGQLAPEQIAQIEEIVQKGNQKLYLPQVYHWINDGKIRIVKVAPFTQFPQPQSDFIGSRLNQGQQEESFLNLKSSQLPLGLAVKIFLDLSQGYPRVTSLDGVIIKGEKITGKERKIAKLAETAANFPKIPVIYRLADINENSQPRGTLRLIQQESLLKGEAEVFLFARNKKRLLNCQLAVPFVRSVGEFLQLKRDLASLSLSRKGTLKMWLELMVPENIINLEDYLVAGFDGAIINLDEMAAMLGGFDPQAKSLLKFLEDGIRILNRASVPIIFSGELALNDEVLNFLFDKGIWGVVVELSFAHGIHEQLEFAQKLHLKHRFN